MRGDGERRGGNLEAEAEETEMGGGKGLGAEIEMRREDTRESPVKKKDGAGLGAEIEEREEDRKDVIES